MKPNLNWDPCSAIFMLTGRRGASVKPEYTVAVQPQSRAGLSRHAMVSWDRNQARRASAYNISLLVY